MEQMSVNEEMPEMVMSEARMACLFLLDTSGSMVGSAINALNEGLNKFKEEVCKDKVTRDTLDVAIVEFNSTHRIVQDFVPIQNMQHVDLVAMGGTIMEPAILTSLNMVNERSRFYRRHGSEPYKPWIILITDGKPLDASIDNAVKEIQNMEENGKLSFRSLGVAGYDSKTLHRLSGKKVMKLEGYSFHNFFDWVNKSMRSVSLTSPGEKPQAIPLPNGVDKDTGDWD